MPVTLPLPNGIRSSPLSMAESVDQFRSVGSSRRAIEQQRAAAVRVPSPTMRPTRVDVINAATSVTASEVRACVRALQTQIERDFAPVWGLNADLRCVAPNGRPRAGAWQLVLLPSRSADCGYHELTNEGNPLGKVFLEEASKCRSGWTSTASHELLELLANPATTFGVMVEDRARGQRVYNYEVCDACQDDRFTYKIDGVPVSDFVYPAWFEPWREEGSARFDHRRKLSGPFEVPEGCYAEFFDVRRQVWLANWGGKVAPRLNVYGVNDRGGSRLVLRTKRRGEWDRSEPKTPGSKFARTRSGHRK